MPNQVKCKRCYDSGVTGNMFSGDVGPCLDCKVCKHCGFDTPIDDTGLRVIFCGNCGQTMVDYREVENA